MPAETTPCRGCSTPLRKAQTSELNRVLLLERNPAGPWLVMEDIAYPAASDAAPEARWAVHDANGCGAIPVVHEMGDPGA